MSRRMELDRQAWDALWQYWEDFITEEWPGAKKAALFAAGQAVLPVLKSQIAKRVDDQRGRVRRWQELRLGSRGGYAAISPRGNLVAAGSGQLTDRDVTRYLEHGHRVRLPSGRSKRYDPHIRSGRLYVPGRLFYSWTKLDAGKIAVEAADKALREASDALDDALYGGAG